ncbi:hypothetical protein G7081_03460 [Vagococcus coleopterorum]|uniref:Uncharacterized protein n=1 Tax=Vagococcus coleopterorum TaxID=2714946 RepID=A0A6G8AMN8_9ENTE|nr:hypothetical protein [Vagococcus coleopterorum]QIL46195.1 hypothetical protein G7081_03460 [Vagococcus coleopterorum]
MIYNIIFNVDFFRDVLSGLTISVLVGGFGALVYPVIKNSFSKSVAEKNDELSELKPVSKNYFDENVKDKTIDRIGWWPNKAVKNILSYKKLELTIRDIAVITLYEKDIKELLKLFNNDKKDGLITIIANRDAKTKEYYITRFGPVNKKDNRYKVNSENVTDISDN